MALVQTAQILEWLGQDGSKNSARQADLTRCAQVADACVRRITGRTFTRQDNLTRLFSLPQGARRVAVGDLRTVASLETRGAPGRPYEAVEDTLWRLDRTRQDWPYQAVLRTDGRLFPAGVDALKITGNWGWSTIPPSIEQAALMIASNYLARAQNPKLLATSAQGTDFELADLMDRDIASLLDDYKTGFRQIA